ncbi:MAG: HAMP domain-containing sensor histidine kinase [Bdellovibrionota bacterium]
MPESDSPFLSRLPAPLRRAWDWLLFVPEGAPSDWRAYFAAARVRMGFAAGFGVVYYLFYFRERDNPFYSHEHITLSMSLDVPLRLAWFFLSAAVLLRPCSKKIPALNTATIVVECFMAFNLVLHTGAMTSYFLWIYPVYPVVQRIAFGKKEALLGAALCTVAAVGGALLTFLGLYPEAAWYADLSRETYREPSLAVLTIIILLDAMIVGPVLGEIAMHNVDLREKALRESNAALEKALDDVAAKQKALVEAGALAAIGEFVRGAAHEIGNPLSSARSLVEGSLQDLAREKGDLPAADREEMAQGLQFALQSQDRVRRIVQVLHDLSVHTEVKASRFPLAEALSSIRRDLGEGPRVEVGDIPQVFLNGNPGQLGDALLRIVRNGREFGKSRVRVFFQISSPERLSISVEDDGPGFSEEALKSALDPFYTTRKADKSHLGLGLFIARVVVGRMGGSVSLSNTGQGARVGIELPLSS